MMDNKELELIKDVSRQFISELPFEILMVIISKLPVRTISQIRCVCKTWCSMISDSSSYELFPARSLPTNLVVLGNKMRSNCNLFLTEFHVSRDYSDLGPRVSPKLYDLGCEYRPIASCNGLVLLTAYQYLNPITYCVSNPIIGQYMKLPFPKDIEGRRHFRGFGFCPSTNKYMVIQFHNRNNDVPVVEVHTLGTYTWRDTNIIPPEHLDKLVGTRSSIGTCFNGALYWMVVEGGNVFLSCFDLENEQFSSIPAPDFLELGNGKEMLFGATGGHLYVSKNCGGCLDVWVMDDYEVRRSWTKVLSISVPSMDGEFVGCPIEVINYANVTDVVVLCCYDNESHNFLLVAYNLKADSGNVLGVEMISSRYRPFAYVPNFVSLSDVIAGETYQLKFGYLSKKYCLTH